MRREPGGYEGQHTRVVIRVKMVTGKEVTRTSDLLWWFGRNKLL